MKDEVRAIVGEFGRVDADGRIELDSFGLINVVEALEARYAMRIRADEVTPAHFGTLEGLCSFLEKRRP